MDAIGSIFLGLFKIVILVGSGFSVYYFFKNR